MKEQLDPLRPKFTCALEALSWLDPEATADEVASLCLPFIDPDRNGIRLHRLLNSRFSGNFDTIDLRDFFAGLTDPQSAAIKMISFVQKEVDCGNAVLINSNLPVELRNPRATDLMHVEAFTPARAARDEGFNSALETASKRVTYHSGDVYVFSKDFSLR